MRLLLLCLVISGCTGNIKESKEYLNAEYLCQDRNGVHWFIPTNDIRYYSVQCWDGMLLEIKPKQG